MPSHPARGAWIEIGKWAAPTCGGSGRTPHGVRGLKYVFSSLILSALVSHPARGAWIEITARPCPAAPAQSHPVRGAWIEMPLV